MSNNQYVASDGSVVSGISPAAYEAYLAEKASNQTPPPSAPADIVLTKPDNQGIVSGGYTDFTDEGSSNYIPPPAVGSYAKPINTTAQTADANDSAKRPFTTTNQPQPTPAVNPFTPQKNNTIKPVGGSVTDFAVSKNGNLFNVPQNEDYAQSFNAKPAPEGLILTKPSDNRVIGGQPEPKPSNIIMDTGMGIVNSIGQTGETMFFNPKGEFDPYMKPTETGNIIGDLAFAGFEGAANVFTLGGFTTVKNAQRLYEYEQAEGTGLDRAMSQITVGSLVVGGGALAGVGGRTGAIIGKVMSSGAKAGATLSGFGTLASVGGETDLSKETSKISTDLRQKSTDKLVSADTVPDIVSAYALGLGSGLIGGMVDMVGGLSSAGAGISKIGGLLFSGNFAETKSTLGTGFDNSMSGFSNYIEQIPTNPAYSIGELIGFSTAYGKVSKTIPKVTTAVGKQTGIIDARIVDTGNIVASENPLLSAAIDAGAVDSGGMLRLDTTSRVSITPSGIKVADNVGTKFTVKTTSGKKIATGGTPNPLTKTGDLDIQRLQPEYQTYGQSEGIPFTYGTASAKSGAGTVLGLLDQTPDYLSSSAKSALINAILPIQISPKGGRVIKYDMSDAVSVGGKKTTSSIPYESGMMSDYYSTTSGKPFDTTKLSDIISDRQGFTPTITPKRASSKNEWRGQSEREHAWTTPDTSNPAFDVTSFGGYTSTGRKITNLGSDKSIFATLRENRAANIDTIKNPAVRKSVANRELNLKNAPKSVIDFYGRDAAFRLAEIVGKPSGMLDITAHGSKHVENVEKIAQSLKEKQPTYSKITKDEVYYASILHDVTKNTAHESVPGGHGEMVGSLIRSGSPLDARKYLKPEAVNEFNSILGVEGTKRYDAFLQGWDALPKTQKLNIADAITQHTTNLKGPLGQTHRVTANKLGKLISDADRVDLRRFSPNPADFTPKRSKTFASRKIIKETMNDVFGDTQNDIPDFTSTSRSNFASISQAKKAQPVKALDKYSYKPTKTTPNLGFVYEKNGSTNKNYLPVDDSYRENKYAEQPSPYTENLDTKNYDLTGDSDYRQSYADTQPSYSDVSDYTSITPYMSTNPGYTSQIYGGSSAYRSSLIDTYLPVIRRKKKEKEDKNRNRRENRGVMDFFEIYHREISSPNQFSGGLFGSDVVQTRDFYHLGFDAFMSKDENGIRKSARKRTVRPAVKKYAKVRAPPKFDLGFENLVKSKPAKKGKGVNKKSLQFF